MNMKSNGESCQEIVVIGKRQNVKEKKKMKDARKFLGVCSLLFSSKPHSHPLSPALSLLSPVFRKYAE